ncbi:MAG: glycosyltransferase family 39 protein [bacterium]|nr:glycosyltransferase family 39 protein [bacterium]
MGNKKIAVFFIFLIGLQMLSGFLFPAYDDSPYWRTVEDLDFYQGHSFDSFDNAFIQKIYPLIANYHMNLDDGGYLLIAHDFPLHYFKGNYTLLTRPIYPILVSWVAKPLHLISNSYSTTFVAGLLTNFILFFFTVYLFYWLIKKYISSRAAFLSSLLLIFSPFAHIWLTQPETNILAVFSIILSLYLLDNYVGAPSLRKLIIFSLAIGVLLLGKKIFAISIFIALLALIFKRYKEGIIFFALHLFPLAFWSFWITRVWGLPFYVDEVSRWGFGEWIFGIFSLPWYQTFQTFIGSVPNFISMVIYGFMLLPLIFALIGYKRLVLKGKGIIISTFILSFFVLIFGMQIYIPRFGFWLFPVVLPLAVLGIDVVADFLKKYKRWYALTFYAFIYSLTIFISFLNVYKFINYG